MVEYKKSFKRVNKCFWSLRLVSSNSDSDSHFFHVNGDL